MSARADSILGVLLASGIAIIGSILLAHWAACEQYEGLCAMALLLQSMVREPIAEHELDKRIADKQIVSGRPCMACYPQSCGECAVIAPQPAEASTEVGAEQRGHRRMNPLIAHWLALRRWWLG